MKKKKKNNGDAGWCMASHRMVISITQFYRMIGQLSGLGLHVDYSIQTLHPVSDYGTTADGPLEIRIIFHPKLEIQRV